MCGYMKKTLSIVLYTITAILCVTLISALFIWLNSDRCAADICSEIIFARDIVVATIPLIGIFIMLIIINNRKSRGFEERNVKK